jgi:hypothetical protein
MLHKRHFKKICIFWNTLTHTDLLDPTFNDINVTPNPHLRTATMLIGD